VFPRTIDAAQAGDEVTVFVRRDPQAQALALTVGGVRTVIAPVGATPVLLGRAVAAAEIAELEHRLALAAPTGPAADPLRGEIIQRSIAARVVSSQTSMLVLESDADYARYGIDRTALADILAIGPSGVELLHRAAPPPVQIAAPRSAAPKQALRIARDKAKDRDEEEKAGKEENVAREEKVASTPEAAGPAPGDVPGDEQALLGKRTDLRQVQAEAQAELPQKKADAPAPEPAPASPPARPAPRGGDGTEAHLGSRSLAWDAAPADPAPHRREAVVGASAGSAAGPAQTVRPAPVSPPPPPPPHRVSNDRRALSIDPSADGVVEASAAGRIAEPDDDGLAGHRHLPALRGPLADIERALAAGNVDRALVAARGWHDRDPGDVLALIGLGDALEARHDLDTAARVYGSIIDLYPARADFRRFAGERLERVGKAQRALIIDTYRRAVEQRPDHLTGHRLLAYALVRDGQYAAAFAAILDGIDRHYPDNRFAGAERVLAEDVGMIGAAYLAHVPGKRDEVMAQLDRRGIALPTQPSTRFILYWETDGNDVDFHIRDARGDHAWYGHRELRSGGELYADITTGYGPECFAIPGTPHAGPYRLSINYFSQGPMGYGMGLLQLQTFDGRGNLRFEDRPYVIMTDQAFVDLGTHP
jgi:hypothetical protein